jgi:predicted RNase H-like nuclease (RuvC/YqgF family)
LLEDPHVSQTDQKNIPVVSPEIPERSPEIPILKARNEELEKQIHDLEESLRKAPEISEFSRLQSRAEELEKHNQTLKGELSKAERDKEDLKATYNNYFLQVQTLINQKAIEAPGEKRKPWYKFW